MNPRALVTGASGFIGGHLARTLVDQGWSVSALQRDRTAGSAPVAALRTAGVDILTFEDGTGVRRAASESTFDAVFHLATHYLKSHVPDDIPSLIDANITFGTQLFEGLRNSEAPIVSALSFFQFAGGAPTPVSLYSATKQAFFEVSEYYRAVLGLPIVQVVLYDTYGPGDTRDKLIPQLLAAARDGSPISIGPRAQQLDLLFVDDVVTGLVAAAFGSQADGHVLALHASELVTVGDVVSELGLVAGTAIDATFNDSAPVNDIAASAGTWPAPAAWQGARSLREGLEATWRGF